MASATKEYKIVINGLKESVSQVDALNKQLDALEKRMNDLQGKGINVGSVKVDSSSLKEQDNIQKQILSTEQKISDARDKEYQNVIKLKDELKQAKVEAEGLAASSKLMDNNYSDKTMAGLKEQLKDIKRVLNTTEIDSPMFKQLTEEANTINQKLKDIEASYGQFGRNVGNYTNSFKEAFNGFTMTIGETEVKFNSLRDASMQLKNAMGSLEIQEKGNTKEYKQLKDALEAVTKANQRLESSMKDVQSSSKTMDRLMDTMQSFTAIASVGNGLKAFFGIDDTEIQRSIQRLLALQNVLQGIETIRRQMNTSEGIGVILARGNAAIDSFVNGLFGVQKAANGITTASKAATIAARGLSIALKGLGIGLAVAGLSALVANISKVNSKVKELTDSTARFERQLKTINAQYEYRMQLLNNLFVAGNIGYNDYVSIVLNTENKYLQDNIELLKERDRALRSSDSTNILSKFTYDPVRDVNNSRGIGDRIYSDRIDTKSNYGLFNNFRTNETIIGLDNMIKRYEELDEVIDAATDKINEGQSIIGDLGESAVVTGKKIANLAGRYDELDVATVKSNGVLQANYAKINASAQQQEIGKAIMDSFVRSINGLTIETEEGRKKVDELWKKLNEGGAIAKIALNLDHYYEDEKTVEGINNVINLLKTFHDRLSTDSTEYLQNKAQWDIDAMKDGFSKTMEEINKAEKEELTKWTGNKDAEKAIRAKYERQRIDARKAEAQAARGSQNEVTNAVIEAMEDGLKKTIAQIEQERKERIQAAEESERDVAAKREAINALYDKRILDAKRDWAEKMQDTYENMWQTILDTAAENEQRMNEVLIHQSDLNLTTSIRDLIDFDNLSDLAYKSDNSNLKKKTKELLGITNEDVEDINTQFDRILAKRFEFYEDSTDLQIKANKEQEALQKKNLKIQYDRDVDNENLRYKQQKRALEKERDQLIKAGENEVEINEKYNTWLEEAKKNHDATIEVLAAEHEVSMNQITQETVRNDQNIVEKGFSEQLNDYREYYERLQDLANNSTVKNSFGILNINATMSNIKKVREGYKKLLEGLTKEREKLDEQFKSGAISEEGYKSAVSNIDGFIRETQNRLAELSKYEKDAISELMTDINTYVQAGAQVMTSLLNLVWTAQDEAYEREKEQLEKEAEEYEEMLEKQEEATEKYKDAINDIEDELSSARGDRRQELIDQLNAEKAAQRESLKEKKRIEKEQEKIEEKKEKLELEQKKRQKKRDITTALINASLAVSYAATNLWPTPAIPLMAAAAAAGALQVAAIKAQKYATGGIIEGKSHAQGGVKVLGGRAEVEGGEYIVNKRTTAKNAPLLSYINAKDKKIELEDIVDFYGSGVRRTIHAVSPQRKFADGGVIPTLNNDITFNDRLLDSFERYSNRPVVVSVVEIEDRMADVNSVRALAGLTE